MKRHYERRPIYEVLKILNLREYLYLILEYKSIKHRYLGVVWGLYVSGTITFSSFLRLENLIEKIADGKIFSFRKKTT